MKSGHGSIAARYAFLVSNLTPYYGLGEAGSIARIVFEDAFQLRDGKSAGAFPEQYRLRFDEILERLLQREPVQYILGQADFYGYKFEVDPRVLIPRQETEELVHWVLESCKAEALDGKRLLEVGSGSGCIPIVLGKKRPELEIVSVDVSEGALNVARRNGERLGASIDWRRLDFLDPATWSGLGVFDLLVSNPPYIDPLEREHIPAHVFEFEPHQALFTENNPMEFYKSFAQFSSDYMKRSGKIFLECNEFRINEVSEVFKKTGHETIEARRDMNRKYRMMMIIK